MGLGSLTRPDLIFTEIAAADRSQILRTFAEKIGQSGCLSRALCDPDTLFQCFWEREQLGSTGIGGGIALPHCKIGGLAKALLALGVVPEGVDFEAVDGLPVRLFFLVLSPSEAPAEHLQVLSAISRWIKGAEKTGTIETILALPDARAIHDFLQREGG